MGWLILLGLPAVIALSGCNGGAGIDDQAVIDQLRDAGADLPQPREVRYYLYAPDEPGARQVGAIVERPGRAVTVQPAATGSNWLVLVSETIVVEIDTMQGRAAEFGIALDPVGGQYDGWEAAVSP